MNKAQKKFNREITKYLRIRASIGSPLLNCNYRRFRRMIKARYGVKFNAVSMLFGKRNSST